MANNKQHNFASPLNVAGNWSYAGDLALPYIHAAVISAPTLHGGKVTLLDGVRYKAIIPVMSNQSLIQSGSCDFDTTATTTLSERVLEVTQQMVNLQLCKGTFNNATGVTAGAAWWQGDAYSIESGVPDDFADALLLYVAKEVQANIENTIWNGEVGGATGYAAFDGFKHIIGGAANCNNTETLGATRELDNHTEVLGALNYILEKAPAPLIGDYENTKIYVNPITVQVYNMALGANALGVAVNSSAIQDGRSTQFLGYELVASTGIPAGEACISSVRNMFVGIGTAESDSMAQALDMTPLDGSDNYRITMRFAVGCQVGVCADAVWFNA